MSLKQNVSLGWVAAWLCVVAPARVWACASCGSGGDSPLLVYPNEAYKVYGGTSYVTGLQNIDTNGRLLKGGTPDSKLTYTFHAGMTLSPDAFVTVGFGVQQNSRNGESQAGVQDPLLGGRYTLVPQDISQMAIPQVQLLGLFKPSFAKSIHQTERADNLDVFGSGFHETSVGLDFWHAMTPFKMGYASLVTYRFPREFQGVEWAPGVKIRNNFTFGFGNNSAKIIAGYIRTDETARKVDGDIVSGSEVHDNGAFLTADGSIESWTIRGTCSATSIFGSNKNTFQSRSFTVAAMKSF